ncbi:uncharacterized protein LOC106150736 [Lingula anatina]|uniref:Uncharacterized protein LOC106150736 n=1 Tax=Lingula anatina TaxID=7574 RepID=A0A1S3H112_LINAN|nr:uncharacterized protein LOC106150736 [Lingula anatina]|eukprot:XP_013379171.1 uncharacterized protein LOC106150736 [Lingula anatina]
MSGAGCVVGGREMSSLSVACYIGSKIESLLGNSISVKCMVEDERSVFASCAAEILENLEVNHPAYHIINDACQNHHKTYGCCCKTLLVMIKLWAESAQELLEQGVPIQAIVSGFQEGLEACISSLQPVCINVSHSHPLEIDTMIANTVDNPAGQKQCVSASIKDKAAWEKDGHLCSLKECNAVKREGISVCSQENVLVEKAELPEKCEHVNGLTNCGILSGNSAENNTGTNQSGQSANTLIVDDHFTCKVDREDGHLTNKVDRGTVDQDDPNDISWYFADGQVPAPPSIDQETLDLLDRSSRLLTSMVLPGQNIENGRNRLENCSVFENPVPTNFDAFDHFASSDVNVYSHCQSKPVEVPGDVNYSSYEGHVADTECQGHLTDSDDEFDSCFDEIQYKTKTEPLLNGRTGKTHFEEKKIHLKNKTSVLDKREMNETICPSPIADSTTNQTKTCVDVLGETVLGETVCSRSIVDSLALQSNSETNTVTRQSQRKLSDINSGITFESGPKQVKTLNAVKIRNRHMTRQT